ncbi:hypothetical protein EPUS_01240 [Endocarpon pusillum Z07020]|uniref:Cytochrome P450 n=1 Tax=Endocarpon pusillum (strain Z07020 / HMAS-L-300199) TaxID=1263415 RepID=U1I1R0_ENDPU|nr:uncharacterized protein EPUS_01240 [Endocarpon pusillum Z07020]ERF75874.1 hypothetical protein EPUS_01240 [Endocarpon pusillum Z07020]
MVSVSDPAEILNLYSFTGKFVKSDFYHVLLFYAKGKPVPTIFATQNENLHRMLKKPIAGIYLMSNLMSFKPYVDTTISYFFARLDKLFVQTGDVCDLGAWLQMFAFDVMGELTFSKRLGFLERAEDVDGIMGSIWHYFHKTSPVDWLWAKNPILQRLQSVRMNPIVGFGLARIAERKSAAKNPSDKESSTNSRDFLSRFLEAQAKDKSIPPWALIARTTSNVTAGSDTTAILLRTTIHRLLSHPATLSRLLSELASLPHSAPSTPASALSPLTRRVHQRSWASASALRAAARTGRAARGSDSVWAKV